MSVENFSSRDLGLNDAMKVGLTIEKGIELQKQVKKLYEEREKMLLGEIPINPEVGKSGDKGKPIVEEDQNNEISKIYINFANKIKSAYL